MLKMVKYNTKQASEMMISTRYKIRRIVILIFFPTVTCIRTHRSYTGGRKMEKLLSAKLIYNINGYFYIIYTFSA